MSDEPQEETVEPLFPQALSEDEAAAKLLDLETKQNDEPEQEENDPEQEETDADTSDEEPGDEDTGDAEDADAGEQDPSENEDEEVEDEEDDSEEASSEDDDPRYTVKIDGEEAEVTLSEALAGYIRHSTFTKRTQALAEERKALQERQQSLQTEHERYTAALGELEETLAALTPQEPDWQKLRAENPEIYPEAHAEFQRRKQAIEQVKEARAAAEQQQAEALAAAHREKLAMERTQLLSAVPEWSDPEKAAAEQQSLVSYAEKMGYTPEDLEQVTDHRAILLLRKAMKYDQIAEKGRKAVRKAVKPGKKTLKPGTSGSKSPKAKTSRARERLRRTGDIDDAARALLDLTGG